MNLSTLKYAEGSRTTRKRIGRGQGSGLGKTSGRGSKGHQSRSGFSYGNKEGGQMPLHRRLPKFGFTNPNRLEYQGVNLSDLAKMVETKKITDGKVSPEVLHKLGILKKAEKVKILGDGEITVKLDVITHGISAAAKEKIEKAGGKVTVLRTQKEAVAEANKAEKAKKKAAKVAGKKSAKAKA
jgi:large subunit ribosomal protein L15